ncbi:MAG: antitoxin family protein [Caldilineaceae bacterium]|nr:antitoxin family protein [Caldilineaceae bacterium]
MTIKVLEAIYEKGVFRIKATEDLSLSEGQEVILTVETVEEEDPLLLLTHIYDGLSEPEIEEIEEAVLDRSPFFADRNNTE